jgi:predicted Zn-dependent peptidase
MVRGGSLLDPPEKVGLAAAGLAAVVDGGTVALPGKQLSRQLASWGAIVLAETGARISALRFRALSENRSQTLPVILELAATPAFQVEAVDAGLERFRGTIIQRRLNPASTVATEYARQIYGPGTPFGVRMDQDHLDNIGFADLRNFHRRWFTPAGAVLALEGDFLQSETEAEIRQLFAKWPARPAVSPQWPAWQHQLSPGVYHIVQRSSRRSQFALGHVGGQLTDPDHAGMLVLMELLGGGGPNRIRSRLRPEWDATVSSVWQPDLEPGLFRVAGSAAQAATTDALKAILSEIDRLGSEPIGEREFEEAKLRAQAQLATRYSRPITHLFDVAASDLFGYPQNYAAELLQQIAQVQRTDLPGLVRKRLRSADVTIVVAGSDILYDKPLTALNRKVIPLDTAPEPPRLPQPRLDAASLEQGRQWVHRMNEALGPPDKVRSIRQLSARYEGKVWLGGTPTPSKRWDRWIADDIFRQDQEFGADRQIIFYDGKIGWSWNRRGLTALPTTIIRQAQGEIFRLLFRLAQSGTMSNRTVSHAGSNMIDVSSESGQSVRILLDEETGLPQRLRYWTNDGAGTPVSAEEDLFDWIEHDGVKLPGRVIVKQNGKLLEDVRLLEVAFSGFDIAELEKKP